MPQSFRHSTFACLFATLLAATPAVSAQAQHHHDAPPVAAEPQATAAEPAPLDATSAPMDGHEHMEHASHSMPTHAAHAMQGALGPYPAAREASGTAWQPDVSRHGGLHAMHGDWMLMAHGVLNSVYDHQSGPRGDDAAFVSGMFMGMARRPLGAGTLQFKAMLSPDPLMGARGYPLLLASGETADGVEHLVDRQHPHDFFMELSASVSQAVGARASVFGYAGLPGEPAFGPPAFMHREAIMESPEAPITHHWLDSTHISMGVLTAGVVMDKVKFEVSRFNAREPDQHRWNIETGALDSTAVRVSWNPVGALSLQASWGRFREPEQLEPGVDQDRASASVLYAHDLASGWHVAGTAAWGRKSVEHHGERLADDAFALEGSAQREHWTVFARAERTENRELVEAEDGHGAAYAVGKLSLGGVRDFRIGEHLLLGTGAVFSVNAVPAALHDVYGRHPTGVMAFVRLKLD